MKIKDIKKKNDLELSKLARDEREALRVFRFGLAGSRTRNMNEGTVHRATIARVLTEQRARRAAAE